MWVICDSQVDAHHVVKTVAFSADVTMFNGFTQQQTRHGGWASPCMNDFQFFGGWELGLGDACTGTGAYCVTWIARRGVPRASSLMIALMYKS